MKNTGKIARAAILLLVLCMISTAMLGGTFAKYTSEYAGQDTALIAKWDIKPTVGGKDIEALNENGEQVESLDLFDHAYNTNIISTAGQEKIIAPGVQGDFDIKIVNNSDVAAKITFDFDTDGENVPIEYSLNDTNNWDKDLKNLKDKLEALPAMDKLSETNGIATAKVYWRWPFEKEPVLETDKADTALGDASAKGDQRTTYTLKITATATQIAPGQTQQPVEP